jgi:hypothetical protein
VLYLLPNLRIDLFEERKAIAKEINRTKRGRIEGRAYVAFNFMFFIYTALTNN